MTTINNEAEPLAATLSRTLRHLAFRMRRDLEELAEQHAVDPTQTPESRVSAQSAIVAHYHHEAKSLLASWANVAERTRSVGLPVPEQPDVSLAAQILEIRDLAGAYALVTPLQEA